MQQTIFPDIRNPWSSSYEENNYGELFYSLIRAHKPEIVVELGTKDGYSAYHIARGLKENGKGKLYCYDLWDEYLSKYHILDSSPRSIAELNLRRFKDIISLNLSEAIGVEQTFSNVDIVHVDLHNDGGILELTVPPWIDKVKQFVIIEGGSNDRDNVDWMTDLHKVPIKSWLKSFSDRRQDIEYFTLEPYPSVTIIRKK